MVLIVDSVCNRLLNSETLLIGIGNELHLCHYDRNRDKTAHTCLAQRLTDKIHGIQFVTKNGSTYDVLVYGGREFMRISVVENEMVYKSIHHINDWINNVQLYSSQQQLSMCLLTSHSVALHFAFQTVDRPIETERIACADKSTLYSSCLVGSQWSDTLVFGGTALGDLMIWSLATEKNGTILHRLSGHNGVIFSIDCNLKANLVTTTSDDRSVKIWQINESPSNRYFDFSVKPVKALFGHTARVFRSKIIVEDNIPYVISIGEDSNICLWTLTGILLHRHNLQNGAVLWNLDYDPVCRTIFACGSDGNVHQLTIRSFLENTYCKLSEIPTENGLTDLTEYVAKVKFVSDRVIVALTNFNRLILHHATSNEWTQVLNVKSPYFKKYSLLECYKNYIVVGGEREFVLFEYTPMDGKLAIKREQTITEHRIRSVAFLNDHELLVCDSNGSAVFINLVKAPDKDGRRFSIPTTKEKWFTSALKLSEQWLIIADRCGNLHLYDLQTIDITWQHSISRVHGSLGCTCLRKLTDTRFMSTGHDGTIKHISVDRSPTKLRINFTEKMPIKWIEKIIQQPLETPEKRLVVAGFNDNHFVICNRNRQTIVEFACGGGHRYWDLRTSRPDAGQFVFVRKKQLFRMDYTLRLNESLLSMPLNKWHVKPCNCLEQFENFVISGGDDNVLKVSRLTADADLIHCTDMTRHISNVKTIVVCPMDNEQMGVLLFSAGGRAQICVTECENGRLHERAQYMLRLSDLVRRYKGKGQTIDFDPETRFMCMTIRDRLGCAENEYDLFIGCSDGYLRHIRYDRYDDQFALIDSHYYGKCFLHIKLVGDDTLLTAATDGCVSFWRVKCAPISLASEPFYRLRHHESGINAFDVAKRDEVLTIATGGDDQAVVISKLTMKGDTITQSDTNRYVSLHTAQVNGIRFAGHNLYSCGVDQRVCQIDVQNRNVISSRRTCVADAKGIRVDSGLGTGDRILVYGSGLETIVM